MKTAMAKRDRNKYIDYLLYIALRTIAMLLHSFPVEANLKLARLLGTLAYRLDKKHRDRALGNLRFSFPDLTEAQRDDIACQSMQSLMMLFFEVMFTTEAMFLR